MTKEHRPTSQDRAEALNPHVDHNLPACRPTRFPLVLADIYIDRVTGLDILKTAKAARSDSAVILMTAKGFIRTTVEAKSGSAFDYLPKPIDLANLLKVLERAEKSLRSERPVAEARAEGEMVGESPVMVELYKNIARAARSDATALIRGETGSGKELVARAIHAASNRSQQPFIPVDCAAIPENLWESELFGASKGAFAEVITSLNAGLSNSLVSSERCTKMLTPTLVMLRAKFWRTCG